MKTQTNQTDRFQFIAAQMFANDQRIDHVSFFPEGFVPKSYPVSEWREKIIIRRGEGTIYRAKYNAKRRFGAGPRLVAFSKSGGRLYSD